MKSYIITVLFVVLLVSLISLSGFAVGKLVSWIPLGQQVGPFVGYGVLMVVGLMSAVRWLRENWPLDAFQIAGTVLFAGYLLFFPAWLLAENLEIAFFKRHSTIIYFTFAAPLLLGTLTLAIMQRRRSRAKTKDAQEETSERSA